MLADLVPAILSVAVERRKLTRAQINRRYRVKNRAKYNAYRRRWWANRKKA